MSHSPAYRDEGRDRIEPHETAAAQTRLNLRTLSKVALLKIGAASSERRIHYLNGLLDYVELGWWLRERKFPKGRQLPSCFDIPCVIGREIGDHAVLYLQFGAQDAGIAALWARVLRHPDTRLYVFDPVGRRAGEWMPARGRGHLWQWPDLENSVGAVTVGRLAQDDERVRYASGNMQELLEALEWRDPTTVVAVFDADVYSTTKVALDFLQRKLPDGSFLFFDQLNHRADELRAFHEFLLDSEADVELFASNREFSCVAFRTKQSTSPPTDAPAGSQS